MARKKKESSPDEVKCKCGESCQEDQGDLLCPKCDRIEINERAKIMYEKVLERIKLHGSS